MRVPASFLFILFFITQGHVCKPADSFTSGTICLQGQHKAHFTRSFIKHKDYAASRYTSVNAQQERLVGDNLEEEQEDNPSARKFRSLLPCYLALSYLFLLQYLFNRFKAGLTFCRHLPGRYIFQRVLRL